MPFWSLNLFPGPVARSTGLRRVCKCLLVALVALAGFAGVAPDAQAQCTVPTDGTGTFVVFESCTETKDGGNNVGDVTLNTPPGVLAGDLLLASINVDGSHTFTAPAGWNVVQVVAAAGGAADLAVFSRVADGTEAASYLFDYTGTGEVVAFMMRFSGTSGSFTFTTASGNNNPQAPSITTTGTNNLVLRLAAMDDDDVTDDPATIISAHSNINQDTSGNGNSTVSGAGAYYHQPATGASGTALFEAVNEEWATMTLAIEPAGGGSGSPNCSVAVDGSGSNVVFERCEEAKDTGVTSVTPSVPIGIANGDLLVAVVAVDGSVTVNDPSSDWIKASETVSNGVVTLAVFTRVVAGGEAATFTWGGAGDVISYIMHFSGTTGGYVSSPPNTGTTGNPEALSVDTTGNTTNSNNNLILRLAARDSFGQPVDPVQILTGHNNINQDESAAAAGAVSSSAAYVEQISAGPSGSALFSSGTEAWATLSMAIEPPAGPVTDPICPGLNGTVMGNQLVVLEDCTESKLPSNDDNITISTPATTALGDLLLLAVASDDDEVITDLAAAWTVINVGNAGNQGPTLGIYYKFAGVGDVGGIGSYTFTTPGEEKYAFMLRLTGASGVILNQQANGNSATPTAPSINTLVDNTLVLRLMAADNDVVVADPATVVTDQRNIIQDYSSTNNNQSVSGAGVYVSEDAPGATGTVQFSLTAGEEWRTATLGIEPIEFRFAHDGNLSLCAIEEVTIAAVDSAGNVLSNFTGTVDLSTSHTVAGVPAVENKGTWAVGSTADTAQGTLDNTIGGATDNGQAQYTFAAADNGSVTLEFTTDTAGTFNFDLEWDLGLVQFAETQTPANDPPLTVAADCQFRISHPGSGGTCGSTPITITLHDGGGAVATNYVNQTVTITQDLGLGGNFAINTGGGTLIPDPDNDDDGTVQYTFVVADNAQVILDYTNTTGQTINFDATDAGAGYGTDSGFDPDLVIGSCQIRLLHDGASDVCSREAITLQVTTSTGTLISGFTGTVTITDGAAAGSWTVNDAANALIDLGSGSVEYTFSALDGGDIILDYQLAQANAGVDFNVTTTPGIVSPSGAFDPLLEVVNCTARIDVAATTNICSDSETVTLTILDRGGSIPNGTIGTVVLSTSTSNGDYLSTSGAGALGNGAADDGLATYAFDPADGNSVTFEFKSDHVETLNFSASSTYISFDAAGSNETLAILACEFRISHSGSTDVCSIETISIAVFNSTGSAVTDYTGTVNLSTTTGNGTWQNGTGNGTLTDPVAEDGSATYEFVSGDAGAVDLLFTDATTETVNINVTDGVTSASNGAFDPNLSVANCSFRITMVDATMSACTSELITITVYDSNSVVATGFTGSVNLSTSTLNGTWADAGGLNGTLTDATSGDGAAVYIFDAADNSTATFEFTDANAENVNINLQSGSIVESGSFDPTLEVTGCVPSLVNSACFPGSGPGTGSLTIGGADPGRMVIMLIWHIDGAPKDVTNATFNGVNMTQIAEVNGLNTDIEMWGILDADLPGAGSHPGNYTFDSPPANSPSMCMVELADVAQAFPAPNLTTPSQGAVNANSFVPDGAPNDMTTSITTSGNNAFILTAGLSDFTQDPDSWFNAVSPNPPMEQFFFNNNDQNPANGTAGGSIGNKAVAGLITVTDTDTQDALTSAAHIVASFNPLVAGTPQATGFVPVLLFDTYSGNLAYKAIGNTLRTASNSTGGACSFYPVGTGSSASLAMPGTLGVDTEVLAAYVYWAGSGEEFEADDTVEFGPSGAEISITADDMFLIEGVGGSGTLDYFAAFKDVTSQITANNTDYTLRQLTVQNDAPWSDTQACGGGWALIVVYTNPEERFRVANLFHGFQPFQNSSFTLVPRNFRMATVDGAFLPNGEVTHVTLEGDETLSTGDESLGIQDAPGSDTFVTLTNSFNPSTQDFNSTVTRPIFSNTFPNSIFYEFDSTAGLNGDGYEIDQAGPDAVEAGRTGVEIGASWGFDIDTHYLAGANSGDPLFPFAQPGQEAEQITTRYSSGQDLVMLISEVITITNFDLADLEINKSQSGTFKVNGTGQYFLEVVNNGNGGTTGGEADGQILVADILPDGLTLDSVSGTGWVCSTTASAFTCAINIATDCGAAEGCATTAFQLEPGESLAPITVNVNVGDTTFFPNLSNNVKNVGRMQHNGGGVDCGSPEGVIPDPDSCNRAPQFDNVNDLQGGAIDINDLDDKTSENNNVDSVVTEVRGIETDLGIDKSVVGILEEGESASYTLEVTNFGPDATTGGAGGTITVTDVLPPGVSFDNVSPSDWDCSLDPMSDLLTCTFTDPLGVGASTTITLNVTVTGAAGDNVTNTAEVSSGNFNFDSNSDNDSDTDITTIVAPPVASNERFLMSVSVPGNSTEIGGLAAFENDDLIVYDPVTDAGTLFFDNSGRGYGVNDADAVHLFKNGHIAFSAAGSSTIGSPSLAFEPEDIVVWDPILETATLLFDGSAVFDDSDENIDAVYVREDGVILFSTAGQASITFGATTVSFNQGDIVAYDPGDGSASILIDASEVLGGEVQVDALYQRVDDSDPDQTSEVYVLSVNESSSVIIEGTSTTRDDIIEIDLSGVDPVTENLFLGDQPLGVFSPSSADRTIDALHVVEDGYLGHFSISQSQAGSTCEAGQITIRKHRGLSHTVDSDYAGSILITTDIGEGDWAVAAGNGTLDNGTAGDGAARYTFVPADNGAVTLYLAQDTISTINVNVTNTFTPELGSEDPNFTFNDVITSVTYRDEWTAASFSNNDGSTFWDGDWIEFDGAGAGPTAGNIRADNARLEMTSTTGDPTPRIEREFDLSLFQVTQPVFLNFDYSYQFLNSGSDVLQVQVSGDGGNNWTTVQTFSGLGGTNLTPQSINLDISADLGIAPGDFGPDNAMVRFAISAGYTGTSRMFLDNIEVATGTTDCGIGSIAHYQISIDGNTGFADDFFPGIQCVGTVVTVTGHDNNHFPSAPGESISLQASTVMPPIINKGDWTLLVGNGSFNNGALGDGIATYSFSPNELSATFLFNYTDPTSNLEQVNFNIGTTYGVALAEDPSLAVSQAGLLFYNEIADGPTSLNPIGTQIAGKPSNVAAPSIDLITIEGVRTSDNDPQACSPLFDIGNTLSIGFAAECQDPSTCSAGVEFTLASDGDSAAFTPAPDNGGSGTSNSYTPVDVLMEDQGGGRVGGTLAFTYPDAGQIEIHAEYEIPLGDDLSGQLSGDTLVGSSSPFVVRPFAFDVDFGGDGSSRGSVGVGVNDDSYAADADGSVFVKAGDSFDTTVTAVQYQVADDADSDGVPDTDAQLWDNAITPNFGNESVPYKVRLNSTTVAPPGGLGSISDNDFTSFSLGAQTHGMNFDEVGIIDLDAVLLDLSNNPVNYLDGGQTVIGHVRDVGRFYPATLELVPASEPIISRVIAGMQSMCIVDPMSQPAGERFTYLGEPFGVNFDLEAQNINGVVTENYVDGFAKLTTVDHLTAATFRAFETQVGPDNDLSARLALAASPPTVTWPDSAAVAGRGIGTIAGDLILERAAVDAGEGPYVDLNIGLNTADADGVPLELSIDIDDAPPDDAELIGTGNFRYGRLLIENGYGPETEPVPIFLRAEYFDGVNFVTNTADSCTILFYDGSEATAANRSLSFIGPYTDNLDAGETVIEQEDVTASPATDEVMSLFEGRMELRSEVDSDSDGVFDDGPFFASAPGENNNGSVLVEFNLNDANLPYSLDFLSFDWRDAGEVEDIGSDGVADNPRGQVEFGSYRGHDRVINWQEIYIAPN